MPLTIASTTAEQVPVTVNPRTKGTPSNPEGNPAEIDGPLRIERVSGDATFLQDPLEPRTFRAVSGLKGTTEYDVFADADLDADGVREIKDRVTYIVTDEGAATLGMSAGPVEPK